MNREPDQKNELINHHFVYLKIYLLLGAMKKDVCSLWLSALVKVSVFRAKEDIT